MKSNKEYLDSPVNCPKCDSENTEADGPEFVGCLEIYASSRCLSCGFVYSDIYKLVGFEEEAT